MNGASAHLQPALRASRLAVLAVFFVNGLVIGTWVVRIPAIKEKLDLGEGSLGVALLGAAVGALVAMPLVGALVSASGAGASSVRPRSCSRSRSSHPRWPRTYRS